MTTQETIDHLKEALKIQEYIRLCETQISIAQEAINGFSGANFPKLKKEEEDRIKVLEKKIQDKTVEFKMRLNAIK
jgi:hypothetical protein